MNFLLKISLKKALLIFFSTLIINLGLTGILYFLVYFPVEINEYQKIANFIFQKFEDNNIQITIKNDGLSLGSEYYLISSDGFPVELKSANILYIKKDANYADFKEKDTISILNDKELVISLNNEFQNIPLSSLLQNREELYLNPQNVREYINKNYLENNQLRNLLIGSFLFERIFNYLIIFLWAYLIMGYLIYFVFKFSGYILDKKLSQSLSLLFFSIFVLMQPVFYYFNRQVNLIYIFLIGFLVTSFYLKSKLQKKPEIA